MGISSAENCDLFWKTVVFTDKKPGFSQQNGDAPFRSNLAIYFKGELGTLFVAVARIVSGITGLDN